VWNGDIPGPKARGLLANLIFCEKKIMSGVIEKDLNKAKETIESQNQGCQGAVRVSCRFSTTGKDQKRSDNEKISWPQAQPGKQNPKW